ncbi:hypothetical protein B0H21DRAFT_693711 [Amylocystis lapponica]|nr:hypothetical protein B0H21DRAFT_693711 [Amylocystis lapponica]
MSALKPFSGPRRKLVVAFDVGTTYSGAAYALLDPGEIPKIQSITRYPGQENAAGDSKIPSVLWYDRDGTVRAVGQEAKLPAMELVAEDEEMIFVEWFKLHLRPDALDSPEVNKGNIPQLPPGKTVTEIFADMLRYLFACVKRYFTETHANGQRVWDSVHDRIDFVLSHPNGWEGVQQSKMRGAAIAAGLIPDNHAGHARVQFVTEGEASLHFCVQGGLVSDSIKDGESVLIVDAGGGTVDLSTYTFTTTSPLTVEEIATPGCIMQGSTRINVRALSFLQAEKLRDSAYGNDEDIKTMIDYFEHSAKPIFKDAGEPSYIKMGSMKCNDPAVNIRRGQLLLSGADVASLFEPSVLAITEALQKQLEAAPSTSTASGLVMVFLVGGFAASPWLFSRLREACGQRGLNLSRPDTHTSKAVAEGAVSYYLDHFVSVRMSRVAYGVRCLTPYDLNDPEHYKRRGGVCTQASGRRYLPDAYSVILPKGVRTRENEEKRHLFVRTARQPSALHAIIAEITCYRGRNRDPIWTDIEPGQSGHPEMFSDVCTVHADTSQVIQTMQHGPNGAYYALEFEIILLCGLTELKAQISWVEDGVEKRGAAQVVYDDDTELVK